MAWPTNSWMPSAREDTDQTKDPVLPCQGKNPTRAQSPGVETIITQREKSRIKTIRGGKNKINISNSWIRTCDLVWPTSFEVQLNKKSLLDNYVPIERVGCFGTKKPPNHPKCSSLSCQWKPIQRFGEFVFVALPFYLGKQLEEFCRISCVLGSEFPPKKPPLLQWC